MLTMPLAAFVVHQLRYYLAYGSAMSAELDRTGHSYLHSVVPWLVGMLALAVGLFLWSLGRAFSGQLSARRFSASLLVLWLVCSGALVVIFSTQEFLEGLFAAGHPGGLAGIFGYGGWWAIPAALCVGLVLAALFHGARWALAEAAEHHDVGLLRLAEWAAVVLRIVADTFTAPRAPLVHGASSRGPPSRSSLPLIASY